jgi:hypothetical protein
MEIFKNGNRTYVAIPKKECHFHTEARIRANERIKTSKTNLVVTTGKIDGDTLTVGVKGDVWVVYRRGKDDM